MNWISDNKRSKVQVTPPEIQRERAYSIDILKCLAAFFVVCIHCGLKGTLPIERVAVPLFFMITGYYYPRLIETGRFRNHLKKVILMTLLATLFYAGYMVARQWHHGTLSTWLNEAFTWKHLELWLTRNDIGGIFVDAVHLWYFYAVIYCLAIFRLCEKSSVLSRLLLYATPLLWFVLVAREYGFYNGNLVRNFLFFGIPCMMVGKCIREKRGKFLSLFKNKSFCYAVIAISLIMSYVEFYLRLHDMTKGIRDVYVFTIPMAVALFYLALHNPTFGAGSIFSKIGQRYSAYIYIFHAFLIIKIKPFVEMSSTSTARIFLPFVVFILSLAMSVAYCWGKQWILSRIARKSSSGQK